MMIIIIDYKTLNEIGLYTIVTIKNEGLKRKNFLIEKYQLII